MDRIRFVPGQEAKDEIHNAQGRIFFTRPCVLDYADTFIQQVPGGCVGPHLPILYQTMLACLSEGEQVDIVFGLRSPDPALGQELYSSGEDVGHTWAIHKTVDGSERHLWEVGRATPAAGEVHATRMFNAYRAAVAGLLGEPAPTPLPVLAAEQPGVVTAGMPGSLHGKPTISRALAPSNLYYASARMWYFIDLSPPGDVNTPALLTRPMRAFDALILSACLTLAMGSPPMVFGIRCSLDGLGKMPTGFTRTHFEADETAAEATAERPLLVM